MIYNSRLLKEYQHASSKISGKAGGSLSYQVTSSESIIIQVCYIFDELLTFVAHRLKKGKMFDVYLALSPLIRKEVINSAYFKINEWFLQNQESLLV